MHLGAGGFAAVPGGPPTVEELSIVDGAVYAAAGRYGLYRFAPIPGSWTRLDSPATTDKLWTSIAGYSGCDSTALYAGSDEAGNNVGRPIRGRGRVLDRPETRCGAHRGGRSWRSPLVARRPARLPADRSGGRGLR